MEISRIFPTMRHIAARHAISEVSLSPFRLSPALLGAILIAMAQPITARAEWDQWRGAEQNGTCADSTPLVDALPDKNLPIAWESEPIPSDLEGGNGSPVVSHGKVYLGVVWHTHVSSDSRLIDDELLTSLGYRDTSPLGPALVEAMENARRGLSSHLRGEAREKWIQQWLQDHYNEEQRLIFGSWSGWRIGQGREAIDLALLERVRQHVNQPFANQAALVAWLDSQGLPAEARDKILLKVPDTLTVAKDTILCLDAATGKTLWKFASEGLPVGHMGSATCAVVNGRVYWPGSKHLYALDATTGALQWQADIPSKCGSSPRLEGDRLYLLAGAAQCYAAGDGTLLWKNEAVSSLSSSPTLWHTSDGKTALVCQTAKSLIGLRPDTGEKLWEVEGGGDSTPVVSGDSLVILSELTDIGLRCYHYQPNAAPQTAWTHWWLTARHSATPIISDGLVYLTEGGKHLCANLNDGAIRWEAEVDSTISSPILVNHKLLCLENNGLYLRLIQATPEKYELLGRTRVDALWCPTPVPWEGRLVVRRKDRLACFDLRAGNTSEYVR